MAQPYTEARKEGNKKWDAKNLDRISIAIPKGRKATIEAYAKEQGESINGFVNDLLREKLNLSEEEWKRTGEEQLGDA